MADLQAAYDASLARAREGAVSIVARALPAFFLLYLVLSRQRAGIVHKGVAGFVDDGREGLLFQTKLLVNPQSEPGRV